LDYTRVLRYRQRQQLLQKTCLYLYRALFLLLLVILWCNPYRPLVTQQMGVVTKGCVGVISTWIGEEPSAIINYAAPVVAWSLQPSEITSPSEVAMLALGTVTGVTVKEPGDILKSQIPLMENINYQPVEPEAQIIIPTLTPTVAKLDGPPQVALYNTHTGETYALTDGVARLDGKQGGIVKVTEALQKSLEQQQQIKVIRVDKIHDQIYNKSYLESEKTVQQLLADYPELKLILDIHRDSGRPRQDCFVEINGEKVAKIMIVVGSDARAEFPDWQQNLVLARQVTDQLNEKYPGLSYGVRVQQGRYNQHYHTGALLFEIGSVENSTDEAIRAAELLAEVLAEVLKTETIEND